jgi:hypothetical protein
MQNALRAKPEDVREQYERQLKDLQGPKDDGVAVPMTKLCQWCKEPPVPSPPGMFRGGYACANQALQHPQMKAVCC